MPSSNMKAMWNKRYGDLNKFAYGKEPNDFLRYGIEENQEGKPLEILCLADGEGRNGVFLAGLGHNVTSMDISETGMRKADMLAEERGLSLNTIVADLESFDLGVRKWDVIVSIFAHVPPSIRKNVHNSISRALKDNGMLILEAYTPDQIMKGTGGPPKESLMMNLQDLKLELKNMKIILGQELVRDVEEGDSHTGEAAVVQVVAEKVRI